MFNQIVHRHDNIKVISTINVFIGNGFRKWNTIFKYNSVLSLPPVAVMSLVTRIYESQ